eukprot:gene17726-19498_t
MLENILNIVLLCSALQIVAFVHSLDSGPTKAIPKSCLDHLKGGSHSNGIYIIAGPNGESVTVYCDLQSEPGSAWTLVLSWALKNKNLPAFNTQPLSINVPVNEQMPNWLAYRRSNAQMSFLQSQSTHWRATCSFPEFGVDYNDYVRGNFKDFDIIRFIGNLSCKKVEYISIRGHPASNQTAPFWQTKNVFFLHTDSSFNSCQYNGAARPGSVHSEDNFGHYIHVNPKFRCTSGPSATTQYWFGGYL